MCFRQIYTHWLITTLSSCSLLRRPAYFVVLCLEGRPGNQVLGCEPCKCQKCSEIVLEKLSHPFLPNFTPLRFASISSWNILINICKALYSALVKMSHVYKIFLNSNLTNLWNFCVCSEIFFNILQFMINRLQGKFACELMI